jgi:thiol-disulfide isomerase/thioredoxin
VRALILVAMLAACGAAPPPPASRPAPLDRAMDFEAERLGGGGRLRLSELRGKIVIVDFWASWCVPCRDSFPYYGALRERVGADRLEVVAVSVDEERAAAEEFLRDLGAGFPAVWDEGQRIVASWAAPVMPTAYLLDRDGVVRLVHRGFGADAPATLDAAVRALLRAGQ